MPKISSTAPDQKQRQRADLHRDERDAQHQHDQRDRQDAGERFLNFFFQLFIHTVAVVLLSRGLRIAARPHCSPSGAVENGHELLAGDGLLLVEILGQLVELGAVFREDADGLGVLFFTSATT